MIQQVGWETGPAHSCCSTRDRAYVVVEEAYNSWYHGLPGPVLAIRVIYFKIAVQNKYEKLP